VLGVLNQGVVVGRLARRISAQRLALLGAGLLVVALLRTLQVGPSSGTSPVETPPVE